ncbi:MAG: glycine--tRNA ligase [Patescibacteria group bacterium]|nr:glycine--tRNA ligase [Patescibacteria group bacterium]MDE1988693.1 glycine--tRNA ligase [Patescibacteria group bacterium]MDE2218109.1 glycine--tRNA ligase [Patescibacteria group bacterium]
MEKIISLAKRRGFAYPSSEIYGGFAGVYDFGPYGVELKNNLKAQWWGKMVYERDDIVGLDSAIFMSPKIWEASGHTKGFSDPLVECKECNARSRADKLLEEVGVFADEKMSEAEINKIFKENKDRIKCPKCGNKNFTDVKKFNLLVKSNLGDFTNDKSEPVYLRGETCQGIYVNYKNVLDSMRLKLPFGIAQIGKAFRNEISPRQFIFRGREFEQMEMQYFTDPKSEMEEYEKLREYRWKAMLDLGIDEKNLKWKKHKNLVFYAKEAYDIEYNFPWGFDELEGIHARGNYDLTQHSKGCGKELDYLDAESGKRFIPHIIESSGGVERLVLAMLAEAYAEDELGGETRVFLKFKPSLAPVKVAVFPLLKNKPELVKKAQEIYRELKKEIRPIIFDDNGNIGKRYRRQDEIGTPFCVTIDFDTLENSTVTVRDRDTGKQERVKTDELASLLKHSIYGERNKS